MTPNETRTEPAPPLVHLDVSWPDDMFGERLCEAQEPREREDPVEPFTRDWNAVTCAACRRISGRVLGAYHAAGTADTDVMTGAVATDAAGEPQATVRDPAGWGGTFTPTPVPPKPEGER